jgi:hypothetical protein
MGVRRWQGRETVTFTPSRRPSMYLRATTLLAMVIPACASTIVNSPVPLETRGEAVALWLLCLAPAWFYFGKDVRYRRPFPFLPLIGLLYGLYYALSPALGLYDQHGTIVLSPRTDYDNAVFTALAGWFCLLIGYAVGALFVLPKSGRAPEALDGRALRRYGSILAVMGLTASLLRRVFPIPVEAGGVLAFVTALGWFGTAILVALGVQGRLTASYRLLTFLSMTGFILPILGEGILSGVAIYGVTLIMAAWIGCGHLRLSWSVIVLAGALAIISLRGVTSQFRMLTWRNQDAGGLVSGSRLFLDLLATSVQKEGVPTTIARGFSSTEERSANLDVLADVIRRTPVEVQYWGGKTYLSLVGAFVPRFLWPDKPTKELGQGFGHRYGYLNPRDEKTSLNLPVLVEFYANFGMTGVIIGMWLVGLIYFAVDHAVNNPGQSMLVSLAGIILIVPLMNIESDFSLTFGGLIMNGVALWLVLRTIRRRAIVPGATRALPELLVTLPALQRSRG